MSTSHDVRSPDAPLSKRRLGAAGVAAFLACAACCALPLLAAAGVGSGALASLAHLLRPGSELIVGGVVFLVALGVMAARNRSKGATACGASCAADGTCCDRGASPQG